MVTLQQLQRTPAVTTLAVDTLQLSLTSSPHDDVTHSAGFVALNETARELEMPFGLDPNDLRLTIYQDDFNQKLAGLLDQSLPHLGYLGPDSDGYENVHTAAEASRRVSLQPAARSVSFSSLQPAARSVGPPVEPALVC